MIVVISTLGAIIRLLDGARQPVAGIPFKIPNGVRVAALCALCGLSWWLVTLEPLLAIWGAAFCALSMIVGHTDWTDWLWQPLRFALFGFAASWLMPPSEIWLVPVLLAVAGLSYPVLFLIDELRQLPRWWIFDGPEAYARFISGGVICSAPMWTLI